MIPDTELRKGNKVLFAPQGKRHHEIKPRVCTVMELQKLTVLVDDMGLPLSLFYNSEDLQGIPLSPELLENCGFERNCSFFEKDNVQIMWGYTKEHGDFFHYTVDELIQYPGFKYLHTLQNLYHSLTGKEIEYSPVK